MEIKRSIGAFYICCEPLPYYWALLLSTKSFMKAAIIFSASFFLQGIHLISPMLDLLRFRAQKLRMTGTICLLVSIRLFVNQEWKALEVDLWFPKSYHVFVVSQYLQTNQKVFLAPQPPHVWCVYWDATFSSFSWWWTPLVQTTLSWKDGACTVACELYYI